MSEQAPKQEAHKAGKQESDRDPTQLNRRSFLTGSAALAIGATTSVEAEADTISQIAFQVGFNNLSYFAKCFKEKYNCTPSTYKSMKIS